MAINYTQGNGGYNLQTDAPPGMGLPGGGPDMDFFRRMAERKMRQADEDRSRSMDREDSQFNEQANRDAEARFARQQGQVDANTAREREGIDWNADRQQGPTKFLPGGAGFTGGYMMADPHMMSARQRSQFLPNNSTNNPAADASARGMRQEQDDLDLPSFAARSQDQMQAGGNEAFSRRPSGIKTTYGFGR